MRDIYKQQSSRNKLLVIIGSLMIIISPIITGMNFFYYPSDNLFLSFLGIVFFDGLELSTITFVCGILIIIYQLFLIVFNKRDNYSFDEVEKKVSIYEGHIDNNMAEFIGSDEKIVDVSFEQIDDLISQLDLVLKKSRLDVFNLMLDPNGINSPDDFQSAVESLELALSSLRAIKKQVIEMKKNA